MAPAVGHQLQENLGAQNLEGDPWDELGEIQYVGESFLRGFWDGTEGKPKG